MNMIGELEVEDLFDMTHKQFIQKLRNEGNMFYAPHMPMNPMTITFGLSWNFFN